MQWYWLLPLWLVLLIAVPLLALCVHSVVRRPGQRKSWLLMAAMVVLLACIAARPGIPSNEGSKDRAALTVVFAVDQSASMNAVDFALPKAPFPTRYEGVRADIRALVAAMPGAQYAVVGFSSQAGLQVPPTADASAIKAWTETAGIAAATSGGGTSIDAPIDTVAKLLDSLRQAQPKDQLLVYYMGDGEQTADSPVDRNMLSSWKGSNTRGFVYGYGAEKGANILTAAATVPGSTTKSYIEDPSTGQLGVSKMDPAMLKQFAASADFGLTLRTPTEAVKAPMNVSSLDRVPVSADAASFTDLSWIPAVLLLGLLLWQWHTYLWRNFTPKPRKRG